MSHKMKRLKNGRRVVSFSISNGRDPLTGKQRIISRTWRVPETWSDRKAEIEAKKMEAEYLRQLADGTLTTKREQLDVEKEEAEVEAAIPTFDEYYRRYLDEASGELAVNTIDLYRHVYELASQKFGKRKMPDISSAMISQFFTQGEQRNLMYNTLLLYYVIINLLFKHAYEEGIIPNMPKISKPRKKKTMPLSDDSDKVYDEQTAKYILRCADKEPPKWRALIYLLLDTGIRRGEASALRWEKIDLKTGKVVIDSNCQVDRKTSERYYTAPKNGKSRIIYLSEEALSVMRWWKKEQAEQRLRLGKPQSNFCFDGYSDNITPNTITSRLNHIGQKYGIPGLHPHKLRHTMISLSLAHGADPVSVSKKAGHSSLTMTYGIYTHAIEEGQRRANKALSEAIYEQENDGC